MRDPALDADRVILYIEGHPLTMKDLGDEILDEDLRTVFQKIIDKGLVPGLEPGTPWHEHIRLDDLERDQPNADDNELVANLMTARKAAEQELVRTYTPEARAAVVEARLREKMAKKLVAD